MLIVDAPEGGRYSTTTLVDTPDPIHRVDEHSVTTSPDEGMDDFVLGDRELDVMGVLWDLGSGTVAEVRDRLPADLAYTTVLTILRNLEAKDFVSHSAEGKAHRYFPRVARRAARRTALTKLVDDEELSGSDMRRLRALLKAGSPKPRSGGGSKR